MLLDDAIGPGFTALVISGDQLPDTLLAHPLWQSLDPGIHYISGEHPPGSEALPTSDVLTDFLGRETGRIILLRPDRFILATLDLDNDPAAPLDTLLADLAA